VTDRRLGVGGAVGAGRPAQGEKTLPCECIGRTPGIFEVGGEGGGRKIARQIGLELRALLKSGTRRVGVRGIKLGSDPVNDALIRSFRG
jgi:hypothetical protein